MTLKLHAPPEKCRAHTKTRRTPTLAITPSPRILIVEDDSAMSEMIATILSSQSINCMVRHNGLQAEKAFKHYNVDLVITDLRMSAGDGIELIENIRLHSDKPIIIVTGYSREYADRIRFLDNIALIGKPFESEDLLELTERALEYGIQNSGADIDDEPDDDFFF